MKILKKIWLASIIIMEFVRYGYGSSSASSVVMIHTSSSNKFNFLFFGNFRYQQMDEAIFKSF